MARLWSSGFELNSTTAGNEWRVTGGSAPTIQTTTARSGNYAAQVTSLSSGATQGLLYQFISAASTGPYWYRFYFNAATLPSAANTIAAMSASNGFDSATTTPAIKLSATGTLQLFNGTTQIGGDSPILTLNQWYRVEINYNTTGGAGASTLELRLNGSIVASSSSLTMSQTTSRSIELGGNCRAEAQTQGNWFFDDVAVNDATTGGSQTGYPGSGRIIHQLPAGAGDSTQWTIGGSVPAATNWQSVSEGAPPDDGTTFVLASLLNKSDFYAVGTTVIGSNAAINVLSVGCRYTNNVTDTTVAIKTQVKKITGGTITQAASGKVANTTSWLTNGSTALAPNPHPLTTYLDPDGAGWTKSTVESMQIGAVISAQNTQSIQLSSLWALIDYTPLNEEIEFHQGVFGNYGHYASVGDGLSRSEVAN